MSRREYCMLDPARPLHISHTPGGPTVAVVSINLSDSEFHMSAEEARRAATLPIPRRRAQWLAGRLAAKYAVQAYQQQHTGRLVATCDIAVRTLDAGPRAGMPVVDAPVGISISHSGDLAVAACASGPVGIDLERNRRFSPFLEAELGTAQTGGGHTRLDTMGTPLRWVCREAVLKYFGFGLRVDPREVRLTRWLANGAFHWAPGPHLHSAAAAGPWPQRGWAAEDPDYSLALVW
ncbi:hypothetical protein [Nocardia sp. NPDC051832]|uniref:4'-phosphopantetheinyl transferase family protein n=1 Tax=Nocardia sp. NPDC051832 TaxID=3155673 RepID=UPI0034279AE2